MWQHPQSADLENLSSPHVFQSKRLHTKEAQQFRIRNFDKENIKFNNGIQDHLNMAPFHR